MKKSNFQRKINGLSLLVLMVIDMSQVIDAERISIIMSDRIALVIGNSNYQYVEPLKNPKNDANDITAVLQKLNFDVTTLLDASLTDIQGAVNTFLKDLDEHAVGLLFYAGHGMQIEGKNYIIPIDLQMTSEAKTKVSCYSLDVFLEGVSAYNAKTIICILDACRNNPFAMGRGFSTGFTAISNPPKGTIIAYSTSADCGASDGLGSNGLYTQVLKDAMTIPNLKIEEMFKYVRNEVSSISSSTYGEEQLSWEYSSLVGDFYFSVEPYPVNYQYSDEEIFEYISEKRKVYSDKNLDIYDIECMPYVDAYNQYHIPVIPLLRAYSRIDYKNKGFQFSDPTIDQLNYNYISSWGFRQKHGRWYYKDNYVEMGDLLPLSEELAPKDPEEGRALKIKASLDDELYGGRLMFRVSSNIPNGTPILLTLKGINYQAQCKAFSENGTFESEWFSDHGNDLKAGFYTLQISCPVYNVLPDEVKDVFGERNRNIYGPGVKFDPISGNYICIAYGIVIHFNTAEIIDLQ